MRRLSVETHQGVVQEDFEVGGQEGTGRLLGLRGLREKESGGITSKELQMSMLQYHR